MKKYFLAIAAVIMVAGAITIVACTKDTPINNTQNTQPIQQTSSVKSNDGIAIAKLTKDGVELLFDKKKVLANIQAKFNNQLGMNCIMEDIQVSTKKVDKEEVHVVTVSYFDFNAERSVAMFGVLKNFAGGMLILNYGGISGRCEGNNCGTGCEPNVARNKYGEIVAINCSSCSPNEKDKPYSCIYKPTPWHLSEIVYESFHAALM